MGILIFQSSMWTMWLCNIFEITPLAHALLACTSDWVCTSALASEIDIERIQKDQLKSLFDL